MFYQEIIPTPLLQPFIKCYWVLEIDIPAGQAFVEHIAPTGFQELIFNYGDGQYVTINNKQHYHQSEAYLVGQMNRQFSVRNLGKFRALGVKFKPAAVYPFINVPLTEFTDQFVYLDSFLGEEKKEIFEQFAQLPSTELRIAMIEKFLLQRFYHQKVKPDAIDYAVMLLEQYNGTMTVEQIAKAVRMSNRHLRRQFERKVGLPPKHYARIVRFNYVFKLLKANPHLNTQDLTFECGFFDQAHFIKNVNEFVRQKLNRYRFDNPLATNHFLGR